MTYVLYSGSKDNDDDNVINKLKFCLLFTENLTILLSFFYQDVGGSCLMRICEWDMDQ